MNIFGIFGSFGTTSSSHEGEGSPPELAPFDGSYDSETGMLTWEATTGAENIYYIVLAADNDGFGNPSGELVELANVGTALEYELSLAPGTSKVVIVQASGDGVVSPVNWTPMFVSVDTPPGAFAMVGGATTAYNSITIGWDESTGANEYNIYLSDSDGSNAVYQGQVAANIFEYQITGLTQNTQYYYFVAAIGAGLDNTTRWTGGSVMSTTPYQYPRTAFVDENNGDNGAAELQNPNAPYQTLTAAITALADAYSGNGLPSTLHIQTSVSVGSPWAIPQGIDPLVIDQSNGSQVNGTLYFDAENRDITANTYVYGLEWSDNPEQNIRLAGTINGSGSVGTVTAMGADAQFAGSNGEDGVTNTGADGADGTSGPYPTAGSPGYTIDASGQNGQDGSSGGRGWNINYGLVIYNANLSGGDGSAGGAGGYAGNATGGNGGDGGWFFADEFTTEGGGGMGGDGGSAFASGGNGGNGGNGGDGGNAYKIDSAPSIDTFVSSGGAGASGGEGRPEGSVTAGNGGNGGMGSDANYAANGSTGTTYAVAGVNGSTGNNGATGAVI